MSKGSNDGSDIIASGPSLTLRGYRPFRVVIRRFDDANGKPYEYAVTEQMTDAEGGYGNGHYFPVRAYGNDNDRTMLKVLERFRDRVERQLGLLRDQVEIVILEPAAA